MGTNGAGCDGMLRAGERRGNEVTGRSESHHRRYERSFSLMPRSNGHAFGDSDEPTGSAPQIGKPKRAMKSVEAQELVYPPAPILRTPTPPKSSMVEPNRSDRSMRSERILYASTPAAVGRRHLRVPFSSGSATLPRGLKSFNISLDWWSPSEPRSKRCQGESKTQSF